MNRQERRRAAKLNGDGGAERMARGYALLRQRDLDGAEELFREVLRDQPTHPDALRLLGELLIDLSKTDEAIVLLRRLVCEHPENFGSHYALGNAYRLSGLNEAAIESYRTSIGLKGDFAGSLHGLGLALRSLQREREALESFRLAARAKPDWAVAWSDLGVTLAMLGDLSMAEAALRRAVALQPGLGNAQRHLAALRNDKPGPEEVTGLAMIGADRRTPVGERIEVLFALGRLADKAANFIEAFGHFSAANALLREVQTKAGIGFDRAQLSRDVDRLITVFSQAAFAKLAGLGNASQAPVFIVGMPRAGSTLLEQIAATHSQVCGAGERKDIGEIAAKIGWGPSPAWTPQNIGAAAETYLQDIRLEAGAALRIIDKMPDNIFQLGLIATLFPKARVIFCTRDAQDTALSCFFQYFAQPLGFDTSLDDCIFRVREIERLWAHWRDVIPLQHVTMSYEALLADPEGESRRLIAFLDLQWEPQCLEFYGNNRAVRTASWSQVRQPLYLGSVGRWRNYSAFISNTSHWSLESSNAV